MVVSRLDLRCQLFFVFVVVFVLLLLLLVRVSLSMDQFVVQAFLRQQLLVSAVLDDVAPVQTDDEIGISDRTQTMGDDDRCSTLFGPIESILHESFAGIVCQRENRSLILPPADRTDRERTSLRPAGGSSDSRPMLEQWPLERPSIRTRPHRDRLSLPRCFCPPESLSPDEVL